MKRTIEQVKNAIENRAARGAWAKGVKEYALELLENVTDVNDSNVERQLLNGVENWNEYSWGGSALIYDSDIARRLCAPWELKKTDNGRKKPNGKEEWLDVQTRALYQAARIVKAEALK